MYLKLPGPRFLNNARAADEWLWAVIFSLRSQIIIVRFTTASVRSALRQTQPNKIQLRDVECSSNYHKLR